MKNFVQISSYLCYGNFLKESVRYLGILSFHFLLEFLSLSAYIDKIYVNIYIKNYIYIYKNEFTYSDLVLRN